jgi:hypothetical protein
VLPKLYFLHSMLSTNKNRFVFQRSLLNKEMNQ